jgi:hypothetical protein
MIADMFDQIKNFFCLNKKCTDASKVLIVTMQTKPLKRCVRAINIYTMQTQNPQENNVSEYLPKKTYQKAYYETNKEKIKEQKKAYREANKEKIKEQKKAWYKSNKEKIKKRRKAWYESNKEKRKDHQKAYYKANKEKIKAYQKAWCGTNREKIKETKKSYMKRRLKEDPLFAVKEKLRKCVYHSFRRIAQNKSIDTQTLLSCSWQEAKEHFERLFKEGMSWENHGEWHIDHIRPVSSFAEDELHLMNHISNLQPLWSEENLSKRAKLTVSVPQ